MTKRNLLVIDDSESDDDDQKPAAKVRKPGTAKKEYETSQCVSLLTESSDEENNPNGTTAGWKKRSRDQEAADRELAKNLQRMEEDASRKSTVREERVQRKRNRDPEAANRELANKLHRMEEDAAMKRKASAREERRQMAESSDGKAVLAVQEIIALVKTAKEKFIDNSRALQQHNVGAVAIDNMAFMAKNMVDKQEDFIRNHISGYIGMSHGYCSGRCFYVIIAHLLNLSIEFL